jgi:hypothetical protein
MSATKLATFDNVEAHGQIENRFVCRDRRTKQETLPSMSAKRREEREKERESKDKDSSNEYLFTDLDAAFHLAENTDQTNFKYVWV